MLRRNTCSIILACAPIAAISSHWLGGEIRYTHLEGFTYTIEARIYTCLESPADRPEITIDFGDGTTADVPREAPTDYFGASCCSIRLSTYPTTHTFSGSGSYMIRFEDQNRSSGMVNIPNSVNQPICVQALLVIGSEGPNSSVRFDSTQFAIQYVWNTWAHDPGAIEPDGDQVSFELTAPLGWACEPIAGYTQPVGVNFAWLNPSSGVFLWDYPPTLGNWNLCIKATERRNGIVVGEVTRDMTICVSPFVVGLEEVVPDASVRLLKPAGDARITVLGLLNEAMDLQVVDARGALIMREKLQPGVREVMLPELAAGMHCAVLSDANGITDVLRFVEP